MSCCQLGDNQAAGCGPRDLASPQVIDPALTIDERVRRQLLEETPLLVRLEVEVQRLHPNDGDGRIEAA